jgi:non-ribosomal peptide synthetase component E (peptide arylation enzyme)
MICANEHRLDVTELAEWLKKQGLARQKWPEFVEYHEVLPKTASGKVQKHLLRRSLVERFPDGYGNLAKTL